jgi:tRNA1(Val) A37 N6-methylase TrmN6
MSEPTADAFLGGRLWLAQPEGGHKAGLDAVMLAAAAKVSPGSRVLDAGAGCGVVGLCIAARVSDCTVTGIEIDSGLARLAHANAERNGLGRRYCVVNADLTAAQVQIAPNSFDVVVANPPFYAQGRATPSTDQARARAAIMPQGGLEQWARFFAGMTAASGAVTLIYPASALKDVLMALDGRFGAISVVPLFPRAGEPAHRIIVSGVKGSRAPLHLCAGLVVHGAGNTFTPEAEDILRHGAALEIGH